LFFATGTAPAGFVSPWVDPPIYIFSGTEDLAPFVDFNFIGSNKLDIDTALGT
jgi:hypothetical protein